MVLVRSDRLLTLGLSPRVQQALGAWLGLPILARHLIVNPILGLARAVAAFDDRVVDAGVSVAAAVPLALSRTTSWWAERGVDGLVHDIAGASLRIGRSSRRVDEAGIDRAVEDLARGTGVAGRHARRLQSGLAHQYYLIVAAGVVVFVALAALAR